MVGLIDRLKRNRVFAFVLALTLACAMALPTLGFADEEAVVAELDVVGQSDVQVTGSTEFDEVALLVSDSKEVVSVTVNGGAAGYSMLWDSWRTSVPFDCDLSALPVVIEHTGASIEPESGLARDFSADGRVSYTITAEDGSTSVVWVSVAWDRIPSSSFSLWKGGGTTSATVYASGEKFESLMLTSRPDSDVMVEEMLVQGTDYTISTAEDATIITLGEPYLSGLELGEYSFRAKYISGLYTFDQNIGAYAFLNLTVSSDRPKEITEFVAEGVKGEVYTSPEGGGSVKLYLPYSVDRTALTPEVTHTGVSCSPVGAQDFTNGSVNYTITADDGSTSVYRVDVLSERIPATDFGTWEGSGTLSSTIGADMSELEELWCYGEGGDIYAHLVRGRDFAISESDGNTVITLTEAFLKSLDNKEYYFVISSRDGTTYPRLMAADPDNAKEILSVSIGENSRDDIYDWSFLTSIDVGVPGLMDKTSVEPKIEFSGVSISPTGPQDFSDPEKNPVEYTVTAKNGTTKTYLMEVYRVPEITDVVYRRTGLTEVTVSFTADGAGTARLTLPTPFSVSDGLYYPIATEDMEFAVGKNTVTFQFSPSVYDPEAEGYQAFPEFADLEESIPASVWFYADVDSTVEAEYWRNVGVIPAWKEPVLSSEKSITKFVVDGIAAEILEFPASGGEPERGTIILRGLPEDIDWKTASFELEHTGVSVDPEGLVQLNSYDAVLYTVTAEDGSKKVYRTYATFVAPTPSSAKDITSVRVGDAEGVIDGTDITVLLPVDTDVTAVTPAIVHTGKSISPTGPQDFSNGPVAYTVTAEDGTTGTYSVSVLAILIHATDAGTYTGSETKTSTVNAPVADFVTLHRITPDAEVELTLGEDYTVSAAPAAEALSTLAGESTGSTLITFTESYLSTLSEGTYDYVATYRQGVAPFTMTVDLAAVEPAPEKPATDGDTATPTTPGDTTSVPKTGDGAMTMLLVAALLALGGISLVVASRRGRAGRHLR